MHHIVTNSAEGQATIQATGGTCVWGNHLDLLLYLLDACDECLLVSPFLSQDFSRLFYNVSLANKSFELISTCAARGEDQFVKPYSLRSFGQVIMDSGGLWPKIGLDGNLHSKVYLFRHAGAPIAGIVTSANLTESGLKRNHETGVLLQSAEVIEELESLCRRSLDYVNLADWQVDKLCQTADIMRRDHELSHDCEIGLTSILNYYATPSSGNRSTTLRPTASYYIKVSGVRDRPILPEDRRPFTEPHCRLTFAKEPKGIELGDCLLEVAVGGACFLSYYACASAVWQFSDEEKADSADHQRWPYYVYANNLSLYYGSVWYETPAYYDQIVADFNEEFPATPVTNAGSKHIKGAIQMGHSYIKVTKEFGEYVRRQIDAYNTGHDMQL